MARRDRTRAGSAPKEPWRPPSLPLILLGLLALVVVVVPFVRGTPSEATNAGYASIVSSAVRENWLYAFPDARGDGGEVDGRVERTNGGNVSPDFETFIAASFLRDDMTTLDPAVWRYDGRQLDIDPRAHLISGIYSSSGGWRGSILFADQAAEQMLLDERGTMVARLIAGQPTPRPITVTSAQAESGAATEISFRAAAEGAPSITIATILRVGDNAVLRVPQRDRTDLSVSIGSDSAAPERTFRVGWHLLESGDILTFRWPGGARRYQYVQVDPAISRARGDAVRVRDASLLTMARSIEMAVGDGRDNLTTSLDSRVHAAAERMLVEQSMGLYRSEGVTSFRSAATLMDGMTGEVASLASFPYLPEQLHPTQRNSPAHRRLLERNGNFVRMVVGSTAKAPFALAILNSYPMLAQLRINGTDPFRVLAGVDLGVPVPDHATGPVDFRTFLARSSNKYAAMLMILSLSDPQSLANGACQGPTNEPFSIGGRNWNCRPPMALASGAEQGTQGLIFARGGRAAGDGWSNNLATLFCLNPNSPDDQPATRDLGCLADDPQRRAIWRDFRFQRPTLLAAASPDREGFGLNVVDGLYEDYVMSILGGNRGRWTTIGLAQAYARILTAHAVTARLTRHGADETQEEPQQVRLQVNGDAQAAVIQGLRAVVSEGTAVALNSAGFPSSVGDEEYRIFAKTGTPNVAVLAGNARQLLQDFAAAGCGLRLTTRSPRPGAPARNELAIDLPTAQRGDCQSRFGSQRAAINDLVGTVNRSSAALAQIRADASGRVTQVPSEIRLEEGTGHLLVFMVGRYRRGAPDTEPCSLRVAAINFQARTAEARRPAIDYAIRLLRDPTTRAWFAGERCRTQGQGT